MEINRKCIVCGNRLIGHVKKFCSKACQSEAIQEQEMLAFRQDDPWPEGMKSERPFAKYNLTNPPL